MNRMMTRLVVEHESNHGYARRNRGLHRDELAAGNLDLREVYRSQTTQYGRDRSISATNYRRALAKFRTSAKVTW